MKSFFVSSTFKDMQSERDLLHDDVFPRIRYYLSGFGEDIQELDLRWGVDTTNMSEEESSHQVLKVCIDSIDRCKPYFIVFLGERYGWVPDSGIVFSCDDKRINGIYKEGKSVTNLEIDYGIFNNDKNIDRCIFCFRNSDVIEEIDKSHKELYISESPEHKNKINNLKNYVRSNNKYKIIDYDAHWDNKSKKIVGLEQLSNDLFEALKSMIQKDLNLNINASYSVEEKISADEKNTTDRYLSTYVCRKCEESTVYNKFYEHSKIVLGSQKNLFVIGDSGCGKSAFMASCAKTISEISKQMFVFSYYCSNPGCANQTVLKKCFIMQSEKALGIEHIEVEDSNLNKRITELSNMFLHNAEIYPIIFIDGIENLFANPKEAHIDLIDLCPRLLFVISVNSQFDPKAIEIQCPKGFDRLYLKDISSEMRENVIDTTSRKRGKTLDKGIKTKITDIPQSGNPLYLTMLLQRLFMMNGKEFENAEKLSPGMSGLHEYMINVVDSVPEDVYALSYYLFSQVSERLNKEQFLICLRLLAITKSGLSESDFEEILKLYNIKFSPLEFQKMVSYMYDVFVQTESGRWVFTHNVFKDTVLDNISDKEKYNDEEKLAQFASTNENFLKSDGYVHVFRVKHPLSVEVLATYKKQKQKNIFMNFVLDLCLSEQEYTDFFLSMFDTDYASEIADFWNECFDEKMLKLPAEIQRQFGEKMIFNNRLSLKIRTLCFVDISYNNIFDKKEISDISHDLEEQWENEVCNERIIYLSKLYVSKANVLSAYIDKSEIFNILEKALALFDCSEPLSTELEYAKVTVLLTLGRFSRKLATNNEANYLNSAFDIADKIDLIERSKKSRYQKARCLYYLAIHYKDFRHRNYEKAKKYLETVIEILQEQIDEEVTCRNLDFLSDTFTLLATITKEDLFSNEKTALDYHIEALKYSQRSYETLPDSYGRKRLIEKYGYVSTKHLERKLKNPNSNFVDDGEEYWKKAEELISYAEESEKQELKEIHALNLIGKEELYSDYLREPVFAIEAAEIYEETKKQDYGINTIVGLIDYQLWAYSMICKRYALLFDWDNVEKYAELARLDYEILDKNTQNHIREKICVEVYSFLARISLNKFNSFEEVMTCSDSLREIFDISEKLGYKTYELRLIFSCALAKAAFKFDSSVQAEIYIKKTEDLLSQLKGQYNKIRIELLLLKSQIQAKEKDFEKAVKTAEEAVALSEKKRFSYYIALTNVQLGDVLQEGKQTRDSGDGGIISINGKLAYEDYLSGGEHEYTKAFKAVENRNFKAFVSLRNVICKKAVFALNLGNFGQNKYVLFHYIFSDFSKFNLISEETKELLIRSYISNVVDNESYIPYDDVVPGLLTDIENLRTNKNTLWICERLCFGGHFLQAKNILEKVIMEQKDDEIYKDLLFITNCYLKFSEKGSINSDDEKKLMDLLCRCQEKNSDFNLIQLQKFIVDSVLFFAYNEKTEKYVYNSIHFLSNYKVNFEIVRKANLCFKLLLNGQYHNFTKDNINYFLKYCIVPYENNSVLTELINNNNSFFCQNIRKNISKETLIIVLKHLKAIRTSEIFKPYLDSSINDAEDIFIASLLNKLKMLPYETSEELFNEEMDLMDFYSRNLYASDFSFVVDIAIRLSKKENYYLISNYFKILQARSYDDVHDSDLWEKICRKDVEYCLKILGRNYDARIIELFLSFLQSDTGRHLARYFYDDDPVLQIFPDIAAKIREIKNQEDDQAYTRAIGLCKAIVTRDAKNKKTNSITDSFLKDLFK